MFKISVLLVVALVVAQATLGHAKTEKPGQNTTIKPTDRMTTGKPPHKTTTGKPSHKTTTVNPTVKTTTGKPNDKTTTGKPTVKTTTSRPTTKTTTKNPVSGTTDMPTNRTTRRPTDKTTGKPTDKTTGRPTDKTTTRKPNEPKGNLSFSGIALFKHGTRRTMCAGALVGPDKVVALASCLAPCGKLGGPSIKIKSALIFGPDGGWRHVAEVKKDKLFIHENYCPGINGSGVEEFDLALVTVKRWSWSVPTKKHTMPQKPRPEKGTGKGQLFLKRYNHDGVESLQAEWVASEECGIENGIKCAILELGKKAIKQSENIGAALTGSEGKELLGIVRKGHACKLKKHRVCLDVVNIDSSKLAWLKEKLGGE